LTRKVGQSNPFLALDRGSLVDPDVQDYKSLCAVLTMCSSMG